MASFAPEVDATPRKGMDLRSLRKGPYVANMRRGANASWELRGGLGVLREFDSFLSSGTEDLTIGPEKRLGVHVARTGLDGAEQVLVVSSATAHRGDDVSSPVQKVTLLHVLDLEQRRVAEHVLLPRSSVVAEEMPYTVPAEWNTRNAAPAGEADVAFAMLDGVVLFGSPDIGLWAYVAPVVPTSHADKEATHTNGDTTRHAPYGESATVYQVEPSTGPFTNYLYLQSADLPSPTALANWQGRVVLASERTLYISDPLNPSWFVTDNRVFCPCAGTITAIAAAADVVLVWTRSETWAYNPPTGSDILSAGQWYRVSDSVGCPSPRSVALVGRSVVWAHDSGVYAHTNGISFEKLSAPVDPFFLEGGAANPLSMYRLASGNTDPASNVQPPLRWVFERPVLSYHERRGELFVGFPAQGFAWVVREGTWSLWNVGSISNGSNVVRWTNTLPDTEFVGTSQEVLAVSLTEQEIKDRSVKATTFSEVGRGGALDRSEQGDEDSRVWWGQWELTSLNDGSPDDSEVWIGPPVEQPAGYTTGTGQVLADASYWFPVYLVAPSNVANFDTQDVDIRFTFDITNWTVVHVDPPTPEVDFDTPKVAAIGGFSPGAPVAGAEVQTYLAGVAAIGGDEIRIRYNSAMNAADTTPNLNTQPRAPQLLLWIPLIRDPNAVSSLLPWVSFNKADLIDVSDGITTHAKGRWWQFSSRLGVDLVDANEKAMPVDWALKTDQIGGGKEQLKCRGTFSRVSTSGKASTSIVTGARWGLVNATASSDYKDWATEVVDVGTATLPAASDDLPNEETLRQRLYTTSAQKQTYNNVARWGSTGAPADGNILSGDRPVDTFATSEGIRGEHFSLMLWGSAQNEAERVAVEQVEISLRVVGGRRRTGR